MSGLKLGKKSGWFGEDPKKQHEQLVNDLQNVTADFLAALCYKIYKSMIVINAEWAAGAAARELSTIIVRLGARAALAS